MLPDPIALETLTRQVFNSWQDYEWSLQGFGMLRCYLSREVRLHIWDDRYRVSNVSDIHDHPLDLTSLVLSGELTDHHYAVCVEDSKLEDTTHYGNRIVCGPGGGVSEEVKPYWLYNYMPETFRAGQSYEVKKGALHRTVARRGTVTLVSRSNRSENEEGDIALSLWGADLGTRGWVSAESRPATPEEVQDIIGQALFVMETDNYG